jgi:hypothetical protein
MSIETGIEGQLFSWETWDSVDEGVLSFEKPKLKVDVGDFKSGHIFAHCVVDFQKSKIVFFDTDTDEVGHTFELKLSIVKPIESGV